LAWKIVRVTAAFAFLVKIFFIKPSEVVFIRELSHMWNFFLMHASLEHITSCVICAPLSSS